MTAGSSVPPGLAVIVLAAGAGTRMKSVVPKVLHPIAGRPLLWHALRRRGAVSPGPLVAVLGHGRDEVGAFLDAVDRPAAGRTCGPGPSSSAPATPSPARWP